MKTKQPEYPCTDCGGDAEVGFSDWRSREKGQVVGKDERLCMCCAKKRGIESPFSSPRAAKQFLG